MAGTTTAFEASLIASHPEPGNLLRGLQAGAAYRLRQNYLGGMTDPLAHTVALANTEYVDALAQAGNTANFAAITGP